MLAVAVGVVSTHLVVGDDLVIPIRYIEAAIRAKFNVDWAEPIIVTFQEMSQFFSKHFTARHSDNPNAVESPRNGVC